MSETTCTCGACVVPLVEIAGPMTTDQARQWAASEGIELRSMWDGRLAVAEPDARAVHQRAVEAAEAARVRNQAKATATVEAAYAGIPRGRRAPDGVPDLSAIDVMVGQDRIAKRLNAADERWQEMAEGGFTFHPISRDEV